VVDLMLFRRDADGRDVELRGSTVALEVELQRRVEAGMESMLGIRFLASEYPTGPWHRGRIDTLGLDENNAPVVLDITDRKSSDTDSELRRFIEYMSVTASCGLWRSSSGWSHGASRWAVHLSTWRRPNARHTAPVRPRAPSVRSSVLPVARNDPNDPSVRPVLGCHHQRL